VARPAAGLEVARGLGELAQRAPAAGDRDRHPGFQEPQDLVHDIAVAPAQHGVRGRGPRHLGHRGAGTGQPQVRLGVAEPPVGDVRNRGPESERPGQLDLRGGEAGDHVPGRAPGIDLLGRVADADPLDGLGEEDRLQHRVGVLGLVEHDELTRQDRAGQRPHLHVVIMLEPEPALV